MNRREWLKVGAAIAAAAGVASRSMATAQAAGVSAKGERDFYLMRRYPVNRGTQDQNTTKYFRDALLPALGRMGLGPVGVFTLAYGDQTPMFLLLIPGRDLTALAMLDLNLAKDAAFMTAAEPYWATSPNAPIFDRVDGSISIAFEGYPKLTVPAKEPRILQLRTYESASNAMHVRKVEMFHQGEFRIFEEAGAKGVFYSDNLVAPRTPSLTYMLCHKDLASLDQNWKNFNSHPDWKKLSANPRYAAEPTVSRVDNLIFAPAAYSQI